MDHAPMRPCISMITLGVSDLPRSVAFYRGLGFPQLESPPGVAFFTLQGTWLGLFPRADLLEDAGLPPSEASTAGVAGSPGFSLSHNVATQAEVRAVHAAALAAGGTEAKGPVQAEWGGFHSYFRDPDGHLWEIAHNPFFWVGPKPEAAP